MFAARSDQGILKFRLVLRGLDGTMEAEWKACEDFEHHCVQPLQEPTRLYHVTDASINLRHTCS